MATNGHLNAKDAVARVLTVGAALAALTIPLLTSSTPAHRPQPSRLEGLDADELGLVGYAGHARDSKKPKLTASFPRESYAPGTTAQLVIADKAENVSVQIFRAGGESERTLPNDVMLGTPVAPAVRIGAVKGRRVVPVAVGAWPSGVYYAQLTAGARVGYAPFVLRPVRLGEHRVAVVMPTQTWQAYNFRDDNGDGVSDTWYSFRPGHTTARLGRPFLNRGVPPHWKQYDAPFVRWLVQTHKDVDFLSDADLRTVSNGRRLATAYSLIIFSGHHEYVTGHEYDSITQYRNLGGNLMFLSANNFFWKITVRGNLMTRIAQWRDLGRPEAALIGVQYRGNDRGTHRGPWIVRDTTSEPWLFAHTDIHRGDDLSNGGIEIDKTAPSSPAGVKVLAEIPNLFGPGFTAQMTYYETAAGAKVFAAGAFSLADAIWQPQVGQLVDNLWGRLGTDPASEAERHTSNP
jgi:hypothetical protein